MNLDSRFHGIGLYRAGTNNNNALNIESINIKYTVKNNWLKNIYKF